MFSGIKEVTTCVRFSGASGNMRREAARICLPLRDQLVGSWGLELSRWFKFRIPLQDVFGARHRSWVERYVERFGKEKRG